MRVRQPLVLLLLPSFILSGCATLPILPDTKPRTPLPAELAHYYDYSRQPLEAHVESTQVGDGYQIQRLSLGPPTSSGSRPIRIDWYKPSRAGRLPAVVLSPILAGNDLYVREFARFFAARGLHAAIVYRPKEVFSADRDLKDVETHFRESVVEIRQAIDWLEKEDSVNAERIGSYGISLGAILTTIVAAVEPRVRVNVFGLPAGHIADIIMTSRDKAIRKRRTAYLKQRGWSQEEAVQQLRAVMISEPMQFASHIDPGRGLVIAALFDRVLGFQRSMELWRAMGKPQLILLPTGHYTAYLATPYLKMATYSFLRRGLSAPANRSRRSTVK